MITIEKGNLIIEVLTKDPDAFVKQLKRGIVIITSEMVISDGMSEHIDLTDAISVLIKLLGELNDHE